MSERAAIRTSKKECVECWSKRIKETEVGTDWDLAEKRCWRCGKETELQRCHLIPDSLGGKDEASNIVLLCDKCHKEGPNVADPENHVGLDKSVCSAKSIYVFVLSNFA